MINVPPVFFCKFLQNFSKLLGLYTCLTKHPFGCILIYRAWEVADGRKNAQIKSFDKLRVKEEVLRLNC